MKRKEVFYELMIDDPEKRSFAFSFSCSNRSMRFLGLEFEVFSKLISVIEIEFLLVWSLAPVEFWALWISLAELNPGFLRSVFRRWMRFDGSQEKSLSLDFLSIFSRTVSSTSYPCDTTVVIWMGSSKTRPLSNCFVFWM